MNKSQTINVNLTNRAPAPLGWRTALWLMGIATLVVVFYGVENWRGRRAWEECKRELEAGGAKADWAAYLPVPVPDDQNVFKAPGVAIWLMEGQSELSHRLSQGSFAAFVRKRHTNILVEMALVSRPVVASNAADVVLRFGYRVLTVASTPSLDRADSAPVVIPLLQFQEVPLTAAIENLARNANLNYILDPHLPFHGPGPDGQPGFQPNISLRWENLTARQALDALLKNYNCVLVENPGTGIALIRTIEPGASVFVTADARAALKDLTRGAVARWQSSADSRSLAGCEGFTLVAGELSASKPARVLVQLATSPTGQEISEILPRGLRIESVTNDVFQLALDHPRVCTAEDYLAWTDQFNPELAQLSEALRRPLARRDGSYSNWFTSLLGNYSMLRSLTHLLAQRAQCHLLLSRSGEAGRDLALLGGVRRLYESEPLSVVDVMMTVSLVNLYVGCVADGLKLGVWTEAELSAIQLQLQQFKLPPLLASAMETQRAGLCQTLQTISAAQFVDYFTTDYEQYPLQSKSNLWQRAQAPGYVYLQLAPRGWLFQNLATTARLQQFEIQACGRGQDEMIPSKCAELARRVDALPTNAPYSCLVPLILPKYGRAISHTARAQAYAGMASLACALEKYRLRHGKYPDSLGEIAPEFIAVAPRDVIGSDPFNYRLNSNGQFTLYSVAWNEKDDDGARPPDTNPRRRSEGRTGDWVWPPGDD